MWVMQPIQGSRHLGCHRYSGWFCLETFGEELAGSHVPNLIDLIGW
jgi:hypothetical protein